jgi:flagellar basal-body rod modification protein FlgD
MTDAINPTEVNTTDYLQLFMQELTYQDPLKPVDNREFMAQMAQFSALQETRNTNDLLKTLITLQSASQSLDLLGKMVRLNNSNQLGQVRRISFSDQGPPKLTVKMDAEITDVGLDDIQSIEWEK